MAFENDVVKKASGLTQVVTDELSLPQRRLFNVLLHNALPALGKLKRYKILPRDLVLATKIKDEKSVIKAMDKLQTTQVLFNYLGDRDTSPWCWEKMTLLDWVAEGHDGYIYYSFQEEMREKLINPQLYALISLRVQKKFRTKYSLALYEVCCDHYIWRDGRGQTPIIDLLALRKVLGCGGVETYNDYKFFKSKILVKALKEINEFAPFTVTLSEHTEKTKNSKKRSVASLRFSMMAKDADGLFTRAAAKPEQEEMPIAGSDLHQRLVGEYGLESEVAAKLIQDFPADFIHEKLVYVTKISARGRIQNLAAYTVAAIRGDYGQKPTELLPQMPALPPIAAGDIVLFDGEEFEIGEDGYFVSPTGKTLPVNHLRKALQSGTAQIKGN